MAETKKRLPWLWPGVFVGSLVPLAVLLGRVATGTLGAEPVARALNQLGMLALIFLVASLACTPLKTVLGWTWPLRMRKMLGLLGFFYASLHFLTYAVIDQGGQLSAILADVTKRGFQIVGMIAFVLLVPLAVTSTARSVQRLGFAKWKLLHRLAYVACGLGVVHAALGVKKDLTTPAVFAAVLGSLLVIRIASALRDWLAREAPDPRRAPGAILTRSLDCRKDVTLMRSRAILPLVVALAGLGALSKTRADDPPPTRRGHGSTGEQKVVLLELFSSQGCSSCPPAEDFVRELAAKGFSRERVVPATFHVDYWDRLGWKDPFSSDRWTQRQRTVGVALKQESLYTPELVWDGRGHGSSADAATKGLRSALSAPVRAKLELTAELGASRLVVHGTVAPGAQGKLDAGLTVEVLLLEDDLTTEVPRGENGGRTLRETAIVRDAAAASKLENDAREPVKFEAAFDLPTTWNRASLHVAALVREPRTAEVWQALDVALVVSRS